MRCLVMLGFLLYCNLAFSVSSELPLQCRKSGDSTGGVYLSVDGDEFFVRDAERECDSEYLYRKNSGEGKGTVVISLPTSNELGVNAHNIIYFISQGSDEAIYVGEIPASATELEEGVYQSVVQVGGVIYESVYRLDLDKIVILSPSKELIISETECIYKTEGDSACADMPGSFKRPLCVLKYNDRKVAVGMENCAGMLN